MSFPAYPAYKSSGCDRLGSVPDHWEVLPCRALVNECVEKNSLGKVTEYLSLMANVGIIRYEDKGDVGNKKPDDLSKCKIVKRGDLVINSMNYGIGSFGLSPLDGICSPVYIVLDPKDSVIRERFALRIFEEKEFQAFAQSFGNGILAHRSAIGWDDLKNILVALPPIPEQILLSNFLDHETAHIDALIEEQQRLIFLLKEKRQAVISHAVTKGLDSAVPMKDSGIEWLGKVPAHWKIMQLSRLMEKLEQGWSPNASNDPATLGEWGVIKLSAIKRGIFFEAENKALLDDTSPDMTLKLRNGDLLLTRANTPDLVGDTCIVKMGAGSNLMLSDLVYRLRLCADVDARFICFFLMSHVGRAQVKADARGSSMSMAKISQGHIKAWLLPVPERSEQVKIADFISAELSKLDALVKASTESHALLTERRSALISAAVTGKIDVRGLQPLASALSHELEQEAV